MKSIILLLILFPCLAFSQATKEDYSIYSQYLRTFQSEKKSKVHFVVRKSTDYIRKYDSTALGDMVSDFRAALKGDQASISMMSVMYRSFFPILQKDTLWIPLIAELNYRMKMKFVINNKFSPDLQITVIDNRLYKKYFRSIKHFDENWERFHNHYPKPALLIDLSEIVNDSRRAVFYFSSRCGGLCGEGQLALFYKEGLQWKFLQTLQIWVS